jgi:AcrR family transcriptional regulator
MLRSRAAVLEAARDLLLELGVAGVTVEGVSARSGVAKTTLYRQWPDRNHLILDVFLLASGNPVILPTDDLRADLLDYVSELSTNLSNPQTSGMIGALIEVSERDEEFRSLSRPFIDARRKPMIDRLRLAVKRGELPAGTDAELVCALIIAPMFYRRFLSRQSIVDKRFMRNLVSFVIDGAEN